MEISPEYAAIAFLFGVLQAFAGIVIRELWSENQRLRKQLDDSNSASRDLITVQAGLLRERGITITSTPSGEEGR